MDWETQLIDAKNHPNKVDIYDLDKSDRHTSFKQIGFKVGGSKDKQVGTEQSGLLLSSRDWFYSDIHRRLLCEHYEATKQELPQEIKDDFAQYDWDRSEILKEI